MKNANKTTLVMIIVSIIFIMIGCFAVASDFSKIKTCTVTTTATITRINNSSIQREYDRINDVRISYEINGKEYEEKLGYISQDMQLYDLITIRVNPKNPRQFYSLKSILLSFIPFVFGLGLIIIIIYEKITGKELDVERLINNYVNFRQQ